MRLLSLIAACALLLIGLAGLLVRFVPPAHVGARGDAQLPPGPHWTTPLHPITVEPDGPEIYGLRGARPAIAATDARGRPIQVGAILDGATVDQVKEALAVGPGTVPGAAIFMQARSRRAEAAALQTQTGDLQREVQSLARQTAVVEANQRAEAQATQDARARAAAKQEQARTLAKLANAAAVERVRSEARAEIAAVRTQIGAEAARLAADGALALAQAEARRDALRGRALAGPGGRYYLAIEAARRFSFDPGRLDAGHPEYFRATWGLAAWRAYFLGEAPPKAP